MPQFTFMALLLLLTTMDLFAQSVSFTEGVQQFIQVEGDRLLLRGARLIDGEGGPAKVKQSVLIVDGRIQAVGDDADVEVSGAEVIELDGKSLLPGLVMLHEHIFYNASDPDQFIQSSQPIMFPRLYLAAGVTTARTAGSFEPYTDIKIKQYIAQGRLVGPRFDATAPFLEGAPASFLQAPEIETADEARRFVNYWADQGMTSFKAYTNIKSHVLAAAITAAHQRGLKVAGHLCSVSYAEASDLGIDNLEHGFLLAPDFLIDREPDRCSGFPLRRFLEVDVSSAEAQTLFATLIRNKTAITSTLAVLARISATLNPPNPDALNTLGHSAKAHYLNNHAAGYARHISDDLWEKAVRQEMAWEKAFVDAGGLLVAGSDTTGIGGTVAGFANHEQLILLVEAGFTPLEALRIASINGAISMGLDDVGSISVGKRADLLIVDGQPDINIEDIRKVETVFKDGVGFSSQALIESARGRVEN